MIKFYNEEITYNIEVNVGGVILCNGLPYDMLILINKN